MSGPTGGGVDTTIRNRPARAPASVDAGSSFPLGASVRPGGIQFCVYSKHAAAMELLLFDRADAARPARTIALDARRNHTNHYWHVFVPDVAPGQIYGYRAIGPWNPAAGRRFDPAKVLLDPYGRAVAIPTAYTRVAAAQRGDDTAIGMKSIVADLDAFDWEGDRPLRNPYRRTLIYEMHVGGFTRHPNSGVALERRGTYAGLVDKIPYLQDLGITAVELLPVFQFDVQDAPPGRINYWGYAPVSFFAPHAGYGVAREPLAALDEFRAMVKALHRAGIEVILDVVYNHTAEGNENGPTLCFRGLENTAYYILENDKSHYANYTGVGNTLNANHPVVRRLILDSLRYWVETMHVDGFRFDLASILARDESGRPQANPPVLWDIDTDPVLAGSKLIAEAWDPGGLYLVGSFVGDRWQEWNGRFRDDVRAFVKGDRATVSNVASRLLGSPDLYAHEDREPEQSVNFVTCHDGFTLNDLVSYDSKHNDANGEGNHDGADDNRSWNCGFEGPTDDPSIESLRNRQVKNFLTIELLAIGTPMLLMGDEARCTQLGNNNAYCQDNEIAWFDWSLLDKHSDVHRFVRLLARHRLRPDGPEVLEGRTLTEFLARAEVAWHGVRLGAPDWSDDSHSLAFTAAIPGDGSLLHMILNAYWEALEFELPPRPGGPQTAWRCFIDTALASPDDIHAWDEAPLVTGTTRLVQPRSVVVLFAPRAAPPVAPTPATPPPVASPPATPTRVTPTR